MKNHTLQDLSYCGNAPEKAWETDFLDAAKSGNIGKENRAYANKLDGQNFPNKLGKRYAREPPEYGRLGASQRHTAN